MQTSQGRRAIRADVHARFLAIVAKVDAAGVEVPKRRHLGMPTPTNNQPKRVPENDDD